MTTPPWCREKVMEYYYIILLCLFNLWNLYFIFSYYFSVCIVVSQYVCRLNKSALVSVLVAHDPPCIQWRVPANGEARHSSCTSQLVDTSNVPVT